MELRLRRRFGVEQGRLTAFEDEPLLATVDDAAGQTPGHAAGQATGEPAVSAILTREIERPRVGPMRDIVATIQPEQDEIVRADVAITVCVQGAPGTGKTAVGLHRAAWLLYAFHDRLARSGVLVVGPSSSFVAHVAAVLPSLGELDVRHTTLELLLARATSTPVPARGRDSVATATLKGDPRMAEVLRRAVWSHPRPDTEPLVVPRGARRWRVPAAEVGEILDGLRSRGVRYSAARAMLPQRLAHTVLVRMEAAGDSPDDRVQDAVARTREVRRHVDAVWPALTPARVLWRLLSEEAFLARSADGLLDPDEQRLLRWDRPPRSAGSARWSAADVVLLDELTDLLERTPSLGHVVLDEAQDLSPMQLRAVGRRCSTGSATVLGDLAQGTTPWATASWAEALSHLGKPDARLEALDRGFRVPATVIDFAARLLPVIAPGLPTPSAVRRDAGSLRVVRVPGPGSLPAEAVAAVRDALAGEGSVGLVVPDAWSGRYHAALAAASVDHLVLGEEEPDRDLPGDDQEGADGGDDPPRTSLVPATLAKGLEFDHVVLVEPAAVAEAEPDRRTGLRRLYVVLTRAVSGLTVLHAAPLPAELAPRCVAADAAGGDPLPGRGRCPG